MATKTASTATLDATAASSERLDDLLRRVERLEKSYEAILSGKVAEISQEERDRITLSKLPNSFPEAVEHEAAKERQAKRDRDRPDEGDDALADPAKAQPSPSSSA